jgi:cytochrome c biogenesis protein CcmG, thiol:disulfide interchange protein DsbE
MKPLQTNRRLFMSGLAGLPVVLNYWWTTTVQANEVRIGLPAPEAILTTFDGRRISTRDLSGQVIILTFWATWCAPCREELPLLSRYYKDHAADGLTVLGLGLDAPENIANARAMAEPLGFPLGLQWSAPGYGRIWRLPVSFAIDRSGRLVNDGWKEKPPALSQDRLQALVDPLLMRRG